MHRYRFYDLKVHFWWPNKRLFSYNQRWKTLYTITAQKCTVLFWSVSTTDVGDSAYPHIFRPSAAPNMSFIAPFVCSSIHRHFYLFMPFFGLSIHSFVWMSILWTIWVCFLFWSITSHTGSGSSAHITIPCEMEIFNFLWLIWDQYLPLAPS